MTEYPEFARPEYLYALLVLPLYVWLRWRVLRLDPLPFPGLQYARPPRRRRWLPRLVPVTEAFVLGLGLLALAGPHRVDEWEFVTQRGVDVALALDISASMQAGDFPPNRLEALKNLAADFVRQSGTNRIAVYAFAKDVFTQTPLTMDHVVLLELIDGLSYDMINHTVSGGTAIGDALLLAAHRLRQQRVEGRDQVVILITDGQSHEGIDPLLSARWILENGLRLHIIGVGQPEPVPVYVHGKPFINKEGKHLTTQLDDRQLKEIAATAAGEYHSAGNLAVLTAIFDRLAHLESGPIEVQTRRQKHFWTAWFAGVVLALFAAWLALVGFGTRRPWL
ncbi:MAG: VWA domain-containing protein [Acidobacteria bacterium]|nr:VWA domain-containing protein [Acidobacteriota bacterium]